MVLTSSFDNTHLGCFLGYTGHCQRKRSAQVILTKRVVHRCRLLVLIEMALRFLKTSICPVVIAFACSALLMVYVHYSTLPGKISKYHSRSNDSSAADIEHDDFGIEVGAIATAHLESGATAYANPIMIMDFKDLGSQKEKLLLLIIVTTAPGRWDRRQAIRDTWWKHCTGSQIRCVFVTDGFIMDNAQRDRIMQEKASYKDMELQPLLGGRGFGLRFLNQIKWAKAKFDFQYILRMDDDYFLCLKRLLAELPTRPKENLVWGSFHCEARITWVDEAFMIFTPDIIRKFLSQNENTMLCHPHADQQIGLWLNNITSKQYFHDSRLHHHPPASFSPKFDNISNVCDSYLGLHGTYVEKMRYFGRNANDSAKDMHTIPAFSSFCRSTKFDHRVFGPGYFHTPKLCKDNPSWSQDTNMFLGRENHQLQL